MDEWKDGWMEGRTNRLIDKRKEGRMEEVSPAERSCFSTMRA